MKQFFFGAAAIVIPMVVLVVIGESICSFYYSNKRIYKYDSEIGWVPKENFTYQGDHSDLVGHH